MTLRVVFAEDNFLLREGVTAILAETSDLEVVECVDDFGSLMDAVRRERPDAVLTDIRMPPTQTAEGIEAALLIRAEFPSIGVVVLSSFVEEEWCLRLVAEGATGLGYLLKDRVSDGVQLAQALNTVANGGSALDPLVIEGLMRRKTAVTALSELSARERAVLEQMATGRSNKAIAAKMYLSERAIEKHISAIFQKLDLHEEPDNNRRVAAVIKFIRIVSQRGTHDRR